MTLRNDTIRKAVRKLFDEVGEVAVTVTLRQKIAGSHTPGSSPSKTTTDYMVRLVRAEKRLSERNDEVDRVIGPNWHYGLLESETAVPKVDDDLLIGEGSFTLLQVVAADTGAGILYEVSYK